MNQRNSQSTPAPLLQVGVLVLLALAAMSAYLTRHCIAVANTTIQGELDIDDEQMGWVLGAFAAGYFWFQIPGGWLGNRIGTRAAFPLIHTLWSLCTVWSSLAGSWLALGASRVAYGCAQAGMVPLTAKVINDWFHVSRRGICSATFAAAMSVGGVISMGLTGLLIERFDWRDIFRAYSLVGIAWSIAFFALFRTKPEQHPWVRSEAEEIQSIESNRADPVPSESNNSDHDPALTGSALLLRIVTSRTIWGINVQSFFRAAGYGLFVTWLPAFLEYRFELSSAEAGGLTMYPLIGVVAGALLGGAAVDGVLGWTGSKRVSRTGLAVGAMVACSVLIFLSSQSSSANGLVMLMSLGSFFAGFSSPCSWAATMDVAGRYTAVIVGAMNMAGTLGGLTMPVVLGYMVGDIRETGGNWNHIIYFESAVYLCAAVSWLAINPNDTADAESQ